MNKINKILGVVLTVALLASLILIAAPASAADPLQWNQEGVPSAGGYVIASTNNITDIAVGADGTTIYVATGAPLLYKSTNAGATWSRIATTGNTSLVAVAPDNNNLVVYADATALATGGMECYVTTNGGNSWGDLNITGTPTAINDIDVSAAAPDSKLAVAGTVAGGARVWTFNLGVGGAWSANAPTAGVTRALAVKFSPNFASDAALTAVTVNATTGVSLFEVIDMSGAVPAFNPTTFATYPVEIVSDNATYAYIALAPTWLGGDEVERVGFVALDCTVATNDGIYRLRDTNAAAIGGDVVFRTIAYDGATLVGGTLTTTVWRCDNALESSPTFAPTSSTKSPGGPAAGANTVVAFAGTNIVAGTFGNESAFSVSSDGGASFNDISLINTLLTTMNDIAVAADGSTYYLVTNDGNDTSVWRYDAGWQRVLTIIGNIGFVARLAPANPDVIYIADVGANAVYYSKTGGDTKWYARTGPGTLADLAVENDTVAYVASTAAPQAILKTSNGGFTWNAGPPADSKLGAAAYSLTLISEGNVVAGGTNGMVSYTTDGNGTWNLIPGLVGADSDVKVAADGLASGSNVYAGGTNGATGTYRWTIGQAPTTPWKNIDTTTNVTGIALKSGALYSATSTTATSAVKRSTLPFVPAPPPFDNIAATGYNFNAAPSALRASSDASGVKLWAINNAATDVLYSFIDTMVVVVPTLSTPMNNLQVPINSIGGAAYTVSYTWPAVAGVVAGTGAYELLISLDAMGDQAIYDNWGTNAGGGLIAALNAGPPVISIAPAIAYNPGTTYYWKVKVKGPVSSQWSQVRTFTVEAAPAVVATPGTPENGGTVTTTTPAFSWAPIGGTTKYQFQLTDDVSFASTIVDVQVIAAGYQAATNLVIGETYFWRVKALEPVEGEWSEVANFIVAAPAPATTAAPIITVPDITIPPITVPPANVTVQPAPTSAAVSPALLWTVIIIGAVLVIALIVLIVRTRRTV